MQPANEGDKRGERRKKGKRKNKKNKVCKFKKGSYLCSPKRKGADKLETFASGIESHGNARQPMAIKYFLVAILFVLFDVEVIFFYPYAVNFRELGWDGFGAVLMFVAFFLVGFIYIIKKGALTWED